jgi:hypothetical protein
MKKAAAAFYLEQLVPEAAGLMASVMRPAKVYALSSEGFAA